MAESTKTIRCAATTKARGHLKFLHLDASYRTLEPAEETVGRKVTFNGSIEVSHIKQQIVSTYNETWH